MYYVTLFDNNNDVICSSPFENKNDAINYFNMRCDAYYMRLLAPFSYIEITDGNTVLFDYEVKNV